jgi:DNA-binding NarL/FixJ family response regulator
VPVRVAVLSDDRLYCEGLCRILATELAFVVVSTEHRSDLPALRALNLDIAIVDSRMQNAVDLCPGLGSDGMAVVFVATPNDDAWSLDALCAGARGVLEKSARPEDLIKAVHFVSEGQIWSSRPVMTAWLARLTAAENRSEKIEIMVEQRLSQRELEVFRHAATGLGNKELAARLAISEATIKVHLTHIFHKLGLRGRAELAAAYHGILPRPGAHKPPESLRRPA